jgi:ribose 5-phosphate isomerase B
MDYISESEIRNIVSRVLDATGRPTADTTLPASAANAQQAGCETTSKKIVAIGSDHGGYEMKTALLDYVRELGHEAIDCGTHNKDAVDYPDFALAVAEKLLQKEACRGIIIDGAGIGSCIAANKVPGIRAAMCYDYASANNSREHNNANVLTLGAGLLGMNQVKLIVKTWLEVPYAGGRHQQRIDKITAIEQKYMKVS